MKKLISVLFVSTLISCGLRENQCVVTEISSRGDNCQYECSSECVNTSATRYNYFVDHCGKFKVGDTLTFVKK